MKRLLVTILLLSIFVGIASAALTYDEVYYMQHLSYVGSGSSITDPLYLFMNESIGYLESTTGLSSLKLTPTDTAPTAAEGVMYAHASDNALKYYDGTNWVDIDVSGASSLGTAYGVGSKITLTDAQDDVEIECPDDIVSAGPVLLLDCDEDTDNITVLHITDAGAGICIDIDGTTGDDIQGTADTWAIDYAGYATVVGLLVGAEDIELENGAEIQNVVDTEVRFIEDNGSADEDIIFDFGTNVINLKSGTGVVAINWGDVDAHTGLNAVAFDGAVANTITQTGTGDTDDLTISQAGTVDCSLILSSAGSITDALSLITTDAVGCIKISSSDNLDIDAADNITVNTADGSYTLTIAGGTNGDYTATVADNFSTVVVGTLLLQNTEAASDITINSVLGTVIIEAEEDCADAILITADGSTASTLRLFNDTGTSVTEGAASIELLSDVGGVELRSASNLAKSIALTSDGGTTGSIWIYNDQGASVTEGASSIQLLSDAGGIGLKSTANLAKAIDIMVDGNTASTIMIFNDTGTSVAECAASISIWSDAGGIELQSDANLDDALVLRVDGGTTSEMTIHNDQGTAADSIEIVSDDGGITITAGDATTADILIDANDILTLLSASIAADGIYLHTDGGAAEGILLRSDQGTSADSIELLSDVGGITITTAATTAGDILIDANDQLDFASASVAAGGITATATTDFKVAAALCLNDAETFGSTDVTPDVTGASFFLTHASTQTLTDFDGTIDTGQIIVIESTAAVTYDTDGTPGNLTGSSANIVTADGDVTSWIYNGTDWLCIMFMDVSADNTGGI